MKRAVLQSTATGYQQRHRPGEGPEGLGLGGAVSCAPVCWRPGMPPGKGRTWCNTQAKPTPKFNHNFLCFLTYNKCGLPFRATYVLAIAMYLLHFFSFIIKSAFLIHTLKISHLLLFFFWAAILHHNPQNKLHSSKILPGKGHILSQHTHALFPLTLTGPVHASWGVPNLSGCQNIFKIKTIFNSVFLMINQ